MRILTFRATGGSPSTSACWRRFAVLFMIGVVGIYGCGALTKPIADEGARVGASNSTDIPVVVVFDADGVPVLRSFINWKKPLLLLPGAGQGETLELRNHHDTVMRADIYKAPSAQFGTALSERAAMGKVLQIQCDENSCTFEWANHQEKQPSDKPSTLKGTLIVARNSSSQERYLSYRVSQTQRNGLTVDNSTKENHVTLPAGKEVKLAIDSSNDSVLQLNIAIVEFVDQIQFPVKLHPFDLHSISVGVLPGNEYSVYQSFSRQRIDVNTNLKELEDERIVE